MLDRLPSKVGIFPAIARGVQLLVLALTTGSSLAQDYPAKPIRMVVPFPAAGVADVVARTLAQGMAESLRQPVIVENRLGASGNLGAEQVATAPADGYTLLTTTIVHAVNVSLFPKLSYDPVRDFAPLVLAASTPLVLVVPPSLPATNVDEFIKLMRNKPGGYNYASAGSGTMQHLAMELLKQEVGLDTVHVPFKGSPPAMLALMSATVAGMVSDMPTALPQIQAGKIRALASTSAARVPELPTLATFAQQGFPRLDMKVWIGSFAPVRTPPAIIERLNAAMNATLRDPQVRMRLANVQVDALGGTPAQFETYLRDEIARWGKVIRDGGIKAD